jgi:CRP-like cAMP-binding protein
MTTAAASPRRIALLNQKLSPPLPPLAREVFILLDLAAVGRSVRRGHEIVSEGKRCSAIFLITEGIAIRYRILRDGQRHILNFILPGEFTGTVNCCFESALYSIKALTPVTLSPIPPARLNTLFDRHPRLAAKLFWSLSSQSTLLSERLIALGRRPALQRVAHFLLELLTRLQDLGMADQRSFRLPLTQEMISDALGLSIPYVNRVLQQLRQEGFIRMKDQIVTIQKIEELSRLADFEHAYLRPLSIMELLGSAHERPLGIDEQQMRAIGQPPVSDSGSDQQPHQDAAIVAGDVDLPR